MSDYWSSVVHGLTPYVPGEQPAIAGLIKLNTNENPYGRRPRVIEASGGGRGDAAPLPGPQRGPRQGGGGRPFGVAPSQVFAGNGSDEVLAHAFRPS
jgi:histidinol-phosphate aminotransferase